MGPGPKGYNESVEGDDGRRERDRASECLNGPTLLLDGFEQARVGEARYCLATAGCKPMLRMCRAGVSE
jgi:hypothetical protein